jgi:hypothetical protein
LRQALKFSVKFVKLVGQLSGHLGDPSVGTSQARIQRVKLGAKGCNIGIPLVGFIAQCCDFVLQSAQSRIH